MTDDYAIEGEDAGYVPCFELPAALVVEEEGAISGGAVGRVARDQSASAQMDPEREAIVGSGVGFVAKPCCSCCDTFTRVVSSGWGTSEICPAWVTPTGKTGVARSVDGAAATLHWRDNLFNPSQLTAAQYLPLAFSGLPVEYHTRIKASASNDSTIWLSDQEFFSMGINPSWWKVEILGLDIRITVHGPGPGEAQATGVAFPAYDTYMNIAVLCEERAMSLRAWPVGDPDPGGWTITAGPYSALSPACVVPTLIEYMGGTFTGSGLDDTFTVDELCFLQGYPC